MDIFFIVLLFNILIIFAVFSWLPNFGSVNQMVFCVIAMGVAFMLVFLVLDAEMTVLQPYPANSTVVGAAGNFEITNANATFTTHVFENSWSLSYVFLMFGLVLVLRLISLMLSVWKETAGPRTRIM